MEKNIEFGGNMLWAKTNMDQKLGKDPLGEKVRKNCIFTYC